MTPEQANIRTKNAIRMRNMRKQRGLTQAQMAERAGLPSLHAVSDLEDKLAGRYNAEHMYLMAKYLDVRLTPIYGWLRIDPDYGYNEGAVSPLEAEHRQAHNARTFRMLRAERGMTPAQVEVHSKADREELLRQAGTFPTAEDWVAYQLPGHVTARCVKLAENPVPHAENTVALHRLAEYYDIRLHRKDGSDGLWADRRRRYRDGVNMYDILLTRQHNAVQVKVSRKMMGWTQAMLAQHAGTTKNAVVRLEREQLPSDENLNLIAVALDLMVLETPNGHILADEREVFDFGRADEREMGDLDHV